jgi:hypothetical protein
LYGVILPVFAPTSFSLFMPERLPKSP